MNKELSDKLSINNEGLLLYKFKKLEINIDGIRYDKLNGLSLSFTYKHDQL